jgi:hypothetical protein
MKGLSTILPILKPLIKPGIENGQRELKKYLESLELQPGETHCCVVSDFKESGELVVIVSAFKGQTFSRAIAFYTADDLLKLINKVS